ncbi:hypothetical protein SLEP1_g49583 [Rubroshorea leprosula]|uniref:Uncharacterized protein n=1 Tax=Rubroshorea leprosula TaxID=152421 RepID=A0AAV5LZS7_9ROSI|nr:hypothetical protein SLEP1_g49583 [Rubroshorea leprosula]
MEIDWWACNFRLNLCRGNGGRRRSAEGRREMVKVGGEGTRVMVAVADLQKGEREKNREAFRFFFLVCRFFHSLKEGN